MSPERSTYAVMEKTCVCLSLRKATRVITRLYDRPLAPLGITAPQLSVLVTVVLEDGPTMARLANRLIVDPTTLTRILRPLLKGGLVKSTVGVDSRTRVITLTPRGHQTLRRAAPVWARVQSRVVRNLGGDRWEALLAGLSAAASLTD